MRLSDEQLREFERLSRDHYAYVYRRALWLTKDKQDAEDLTQDAFAKAFAGFSRFNATCRFEVWMWTIIENLNLDLRRKKAVRVTTISYDEPVVTEVGNFAHEFPSTAMNPEDHAVLASIAERVDKAMRHLSEKDQRTLALFVRGYSYEEIAESEGVRMGTVRSRINRARVQLRQIYPALHRMKEPKP